MKNIPTIISALLGLAFITFGLNHWLSFMPKGDGTPPSPETIAFFKATGKGFMDFVKLLEIIAGILLIIPKTRNWGLLIIGPIILNIIAVNIFVMGGTKVFQPPLILLSLMAAYLLFTARNKFLNLLNN